MSQLGHVNELFSMNGDKNQFGEYEIDKSYFSQPIYNIVPNANDLYVKPSTHDAKLKDMVESVEVFEPRRNKFLDHLMGRFAESFSDYAMLTYKISGVKASKELIEDKLQFLKKYPLLSASRGKGINYRKPCDIWSIENISGLERRASLLLGIEEKSAKELNFGPNFSITENSGIFSFEIKEEATTNILLKNLVNSISEENVKALLESIITNGVCENNYHIKDNGSGNFIFELICDGKILATSYQSYSTDVAANIDILNSIKTLKLEMDENPESNRKNLSCPINNYIIPNNFSNIPATDTDPASFTFEFDIFDRPFWDTSKTLLFSGNIKREDPW